MITFKIGKESYNIPSRWEDITFNQYYEILNSRRDATALLAMFIGLDYDILKKATIIGLDDVLIALSFLNKPPLIPESVDKIGPYKLPKGFDIQYESLAQFEDMRSVMKKIPEKPHAIVEAYPVFCAIYLQKIRDGEYDNGKAMEMVEEIKTLPALEVISLGTFFFVKQWRLLTGTAPNNQTTNQSPKKSKLATTSSRKRSGVTARSRKRR